MSIRNAILYNYWQDFVSLLFPETCNHCNQTLLKNELHLCTSCQIQLPVTNYHLCLNDNPIYNDLKIIENLVAATAYLKYSRHGMAQKLLKRLKYGGDYEIGKVLGSWYGSHLKEIISADCMIPVPIHKSKLKQRGYNQSQAIAEGLQGYVNIAIDNTSVVRNKATATQTKRNKTDRWVAMSEVFEVRSPDQIRNKNLVIIDDVITTGATIFSLCETINRYEPQSLQVIAIATGK
jgi:ComF family protein